MIYHGFMKSFFAALADAAAATELNNKKLYIFFLLPLLSFRIQEHFFARFHPHI
jgi:hypothetical protein